jgi:hypothetical protein
VDPGVEVRAPAVLSGRRLPTSPSLAELTRALAPGSSCFCCGTPLETGAAGISRAGGPVGLLSCPRCGAQVAVSLHADLPSGDEEAIDLARVAA